MPIADGITRFEGKTTRVVFTEPVVGVAKFDDAAAVRLLVIFSHRSDIHLNTSVLQRGSAKVHRVIARSGLIPLHPRSTALTH